MGDLHAAIQRFHDLICVDATIKAAVMAADVIRGAATSVREYPPLPMQFACSGVFPVYSADQMRAYVDADRAASAPADSQPALEYVGNGMFKGETIQKAAEHWANWCDVRCMTGLSEFLRVVAARAQADSVTAPAVGYPPLPRVGAIGYASVVDIDSYAKTLTIGPHLPGVRDIALWTTDQMHAYVDADRASRKQGGA